MPYQHKGRCRNDKCHPQASSCKLVKGAAGAARTDAICTTNAPGNLRQQLVLHWRKTEGHSPGPNQAGTTDQVFISPDVCIAAGTVQQNVLVIQLSRISSTPTVPDHLLQDMP
jgi:hypothetical protein